MTYGEPPEHVDLEAEYEEMPGSPVGAPPAGLMKFLAGAVFVGLGAVFVSIVIFIVWLILKPVFGW